MRKSFKIQVALAALLTLSWSGIASAQTAEANREKAERVSALLEKRLQSAPKFVPGEVIVKIKPNAPLGPMAAAASTLRLEVKRETSGGETLYRMPPAMVGAMSAANQVERTLAAVRQLSVRPDVEYAQPNFLAQIAAPPSDPRYGQQWHYFVNGTGSGQAPGGIDLPPVWDGGNKGAAAVIVAVIDTGIVATHEDIAGSPNLLPGFDMITEPAIANDGGGRDNDASDPGDAVAANECGPGTPAQPDSWHGTHVAGTVGIGRTNNNLGVAGVNWNTRVQPVRVLGKCGGTMADINDGIRWAAGLPVPGVPNNPTPARVINMSLGGGAPCSASPATQSAINDAVAAGVTVVVAAGNEASDAAGFLPASCANVITVAAADRRGHLATRYSNFGTRVDILAPGGDVFRDDDGDGNPDGVLSMIRNGYEFYNGTSMASPHVAGVAALLLTEDPTRTPAQVGNILKSRALIRSAAQCPQPCGAGLLTAKGIGPGGGGGTPPPPTVTVSVTVDPARIRKNRTATLTATVMENGAPAANKPVTFATSDTSIATLAAANATTDAAGQATTTVTGTNKGTATLTAQSQGQSATAPVKVPVLPPAMLVALILGLLIVFGWRAMRQAR